MIEGEVRTPKDGERYFALTKLDKVNDGPPEQNKHKVMFENLTPLFPKEQMKMERDGVKGEETSHRRQRRQSSPLGLLKVFRLSHLVSSILMQEPHIVAGHEPMRVGGWPCLLAHVIGGP
ncbi:hypothetical protein J2W30_006401 [Variovorax boronicumulans]|nr:hypothetical protein [Variovorax boronicumulans]MDQ0006551.1 hypothetical protein [Variovorax boronicumulans]MDQ0038614.1 hypothetical protein [Variovorax boronicumulans]MDQ0044305.1 hypothetical protein [Variovorax boronicumulans]